MVRVALPDRRSVAVFSMLRDREANIWVAARARGVIRISTAGAASFGDWDARSNGVATALFEDRERDDGIGIDEAVAAAGREGHWGLSGVRERADSVGGRLSVRSRAGTGTEVELSIPGAVAYHESGRPPFRR